MNEEAQPTIADDTAAGTGRPDAADEFDAAVSADPSQADSEGVTPRQPGKRRFLGVLSLVLAAFAIVAETAAITVATAGGGVAGIVLAYVVIALTCVAFVLGVIALIAGRGRLWGALGATVAVASNPLVQIAVLGALGGAPPAS